MKIAQSVLNNHIYQLAVSERYLRILTDILVIVLGLRFNLNIMRVALYTWLNLDEKLLGDLQKP